MEIIKKSNIIKRIHQHAYILLKRKLKEKENTAFKNNNNKKTYRSHTGNRTRATAVRAPDPNL